MKRLRIKKDQAGFSLMELLISMVIMLIVMSAVFALLRGTIQTANVNYEVTSAQQNLRNSQEYITRDVITVGDGLFGVSNIWLPTRFVKDYLTNRAVSVIDPQNRGYVAVGSVISDSDIPAGTDIKDANPATTFFPRSDRITLLALDSEFPAIDLSVGATDMNNGRINIPAARLADFKVGEIYYITNGATGVFGTVTRIDGGANRIFWEEGDALDLNRLGFTGNLATGTRRGSDSATLMRIAIKQFYVDADGKLIRRVFGIKGKGFIDSVVAEHLSNMEFRYTLKPSSDGTIFEQPTRRIDLSDAANVRIIESRIRVRTAYAVSSNTPTEIEGIVQLGVRNIQFMEAPVPRDKEGNTALPNPQPTPQITPEPTPTPSPSPTPIPTPTPTPTPTPSPTPIPNPTPIPPPPPTPTPTRTPPPTPTPTPRIIPPGDG